MARQLAKGRQVGPSAGHHPSAAKGHLGHPAPQLSLPEPSPGAKPASAFVPLPLAAAQKWPEPWTAEMTCEMMESLVLMVLLVLYVAPRTRG